MSSTIDAKKETSMRVGYYQIKGHSLVRYCYIPKDLLRNPSYSLEEAFEALQLKTPELVFEMSSADDTNTWNLRLPEQYKRCHISQPYNPAEPDKHVDGRLRHYQVCS
jgi:hypothetical protein